MSGFLQLKVDVQEPRPSEYTQVSPSWTEMHWPQRFLEHAQGIWNQRQKAGVYLGILALIQLLNENEWKH